MTDPTATSALKTHNRQRIAAFIYGHDSATKQDLATELGLSLPTVTQNLRALEESGLIVKHELLGSTGGRRAQSYAFDSGSHMAIGASLGRDEVTLCAVDLQGHVTSRSSFRLPYVGGGHEDAGDQRGAGNRDAAYYAEVGHLINAFATSLGTASDRILGVAFAIQGLVSGDGQRITFGTIMGNTGATLEDFSRSIDYPALLIHDSDASAMAELWFDDGIVDAACLYLERRIGGAVIIDGALHRGGGSGTGPNEGSNSGTIEHMTLVPDGRLCYCGQRGCVDPYCSPETLLREGESLAQCFARIHGEDADHTEDFREWLTYIAQTVNNVRMVFGSDVIIGGEASTFLDDEDLAEIRRLVIARSAFHDDFILRRSLCVADQSIVGAALRFVSPFIDHVCGNQNIRTI
ncbi:MAG: ROK family protein [Bifidobacterium psychraerophilum]